jgi:uracil-DNA glycosylase family 4
MKRKPTPTPSRDRRSTVLARPAWERLNRQVVACERCPRLRAYCREVARVKRRAYADWQYWGRPVPNFGDERARLLIVGLAPAAHGANRTGRMFTGDRSGDWLYRALHRAGFATRPAAEHRGDGLELLDCAITAVCHCAPPGNKPANDEIEQCHEWFAKTFDLVPARVVLALGQIAWRAVANEARRRGWLCGRLPQFAHGHHVALADGRWLLASYHPSQQNTFTGRLTEPMLDDVFRTARRLLEAPGESRQAT